MKKIAFVIAATLVSLLPGLAQNNSSASAKLTGFAKNAAQFSKNYTQEKAYLHFDNTAYFLSETIWFKAYVVNALANTPTNMSKTLHVELRTSEGHLVENKKILLTNGIGVGEFYLPDSLPGGFYEIRAFTRAMINFGEEVIFSRVFPIFDMPQNAGDYNERIMTPRAFSIPNTRKEKPFSGSLNIEFFPEGGTLIQGTKSNVAFKIFDDKGRSLDAMVTLHDAANRNVAVENTKHLGMGKFTLDVKSDMYWAEVSVGTTKKKFNLPAVQTSGYSLFCENPTNDSITLDIRKTVNLPENDSLALLVTSKGRIIDFYTFHVPNNGHSIGINTKRWPAGVYQYTLYDTKGKQQADRLLFKYPSLKPNLDIKTDKSTYKAFEKVQLTVTALDTLNTKYGTSISLAVRDASYSIAGNSDNQTLATNLLLSSDLKGYIENPLWYFTEKTTERLEALDLLMLTQSGRRYSWEYMSGLKPFKAPHPIEEGILVDGEIRSILFKKPVPDVELTYWMSRGQAAASGKAKADSAGNFSFIVNMYDDWELNLASFVKEKQKDLRIMLHRTFSPETKWLSALDQEVWLNNAPFSPKENKSDSLNILGKVRYTENSEQNINGSKEITMKEYVITEEKKESYTESVFRNASLKYKMDEEIDMIRDLGGSETPSIIEFIEDTNPYATAIYDTAGEPTGLTYKGKNVRFRIYPSRKSNMIQSTTAYSIQSLLPEDVDEIVILEDFNTISMGEENLDENYIIIALYLYDTERRKEVLGVRKTTLKGYTPQKTFYSPTYTPETEDLEPDYRRTLYWNPDFYLDPKTGKKTLEFFHSKNSVNGIKISAEGITGNGTLLHN